MNPTDSFRSDIQPLVGRRADNTSGQARIVTQYVPTEAEQMYLRGAAAVAAQGVRDMAAVRKLVKKVVKEPRQGEAVKG